jgi:hypothetical protein
MGKKRLRGGSILGLLLILAGPMLAACGTSPTQSPLPTPTLVGSGAAPAADLLTDVRRDLAERLGIVASVIETVRVEAVEWSDGSLGCPEPGESYTQALEPGHKIVLRAQDQTYEYHTAQRRFVLCEQPRPTAKPNYAPELQSVLDQAKADLAAQLAQSEDAIRVQTIEEQMWSDSSVGCPQPGMAYLTVITPGYRIVLEANGEEYAYHTSHDKVVLCLRDTGEIRPPPEAAHLVEDAQQDLAAQLGLPGEEVRLVRASAVEWPNGALGCPEPGKSYITMIIPGYLIVFQAQGETYEYHTSDTEFVWCKNPPDNQ